MNPARTARLLVYSRGANRNWWIWWILAWTIAALSSQVGIPRLEPGPLAASRSLEQLGSIGLCIPLALVAMLVEDKTNWLTESSPRNSRLILLINTFLIVVISLVSATLFSILYPDGVSTLRVVSLFSMLVGLTLISGSLFGGTWSAVPGPIFIILNTIPNFIPWNINIVYNAGTDALLVALSVASLILSFVTAVYSRNVN